MLNVQVFISDVLIGTAQLFASDPPMGVASGDLVPTAAYAAVRTKIIAAYAGPESNWDELALRVVTDDGTPVSGVYGAYIADLADNEDFTPEVTVSGIDCASGQYEAWFGRDPGYVAYWS